MDDDRESPARQTGHDATSRPEHASLPLIRESAAPPGTPAAGAGPLAREVTDPHEIAAMAEKMLRTLRVGTDGSGRRVVQLEIGSGGLAGTFIELRREAAGVRVRMRAAGGETHPDLTALEDALRARGVPVL